jgi:hypothetical protein
LVRYGYYSSHLSTGGTSLDDVSRVPQL